uniref:Uncharacterized protein n=1 Tax=Pelusios castaneus TaxID=367368 RepID=A0A8C8RPP1_9SAUR
MSASKKAKLDVRSFQPSWTDKFGFVPNGDRAVCAFCRESVVCRTSSVQRHFQTKHEKSFFGDADKIESIARAVAGFEKESSIFKHLIINKNQAATEGSYKVAQCIAKYGKPFTDGEYIKEVFLSTSEALFSDMPEKDAILTRIKELPVSVRTIERCISEMAENINEKQTTALKDAAVFSVAVDESMDINDVSRVAIVARYCASGEIREELCCLKPLPDTPTLGDIAETFVNHFEERGVDIRKIFCVTTSDAPAIVGKQMRFVKLLEDKIGHPTVKLHCVIHQENLCAEILNSELNNVVNTVVQIVNFLVARSTLIHGRFRALLEEMDGAYKDAPCHIPWLSCSKILVQFVNCFDAIKASLSENGQNFPETEDNKWLCKLMFLTDITGHLNELNLCLQGEGQTVLDFYETWKAFVAKLAVFSQDIRSSTFRYFQHIKGLSTHCTICVDEIGTYMEKLESEFVERFQDFQQFGPMFSFLITPENFDESKMDLSVFQWMCVKDFEMQLIDLQCSTLWSSKFKDLQHELGVTKKGHGASILTCWMSLPVQFNCLKKMAFAMLSAFGSTYLCDQVFSHMKSVHCFSRSRLTADHLEACVQLKVSKYEPDIGKLSKQKQGQGSH